MQPIYLDNAASTRIADDVLALVTEVQRTAWGNPSAQHPQGAAGRGHLATARGRMLAALGDRSAAGDIIWTSGCSEANALAVLGAEARVTVAELVPAVITWARGPMAELFGDSLSDPRADIRAADVVEVIRSSPSAFDAILLDVDNGPEALIRTANDALYDLKGLRAALRALRPRGVLAVWSSGPNAAFTKRLRDADFDVNEVGVRATSKRSGAHHVIWFATKRGNTD